MPCYPLLVLSSKLHESHLPARQANLELLRRAQSMRDSVVTQVMAGVLAVNLRLQLKLCYRADAVLVHHLAHIRLGGHRE